MRRRRECLNCSNRFTTYERVEFVPITVLKRNGDRESFDNSKLLHGLSRACEKTTVSTKEQQRIVSDVAAEIQQRTLREIESSEIGDIVLNQLRPLSEVAYVRFASVYRQFQSIRDFVETLELLRELPPRKDSSSPPPLDSPPAESLAPKAASPPTAIPEVILPESSLI